MLDKFNIIIKKTKIGPVNCFENVFLKYYFDVKNVFGKKFILYTF